MRLSEQLARDERVRLGLDESSAVADLLAVLERDDGVHVALYQLGEDGMAGMYQTRAGVPVILVNSSMHPVRARFTLAHEYGHHCLGHEAALDHEIDPWSRDDREADANRFAAELLLPGAGLDRWLRASTGRAAPDLETLVRLAHHYGVSCEVALHRLSRTRRVRGVVERRLRARVEAGEHRDLAWRLGLPELDDTLARDRRLRVRMPAPTRHTVLRALAQGLIDAETAAERLHVDRLEIQRMRRFEPAPDRGGDGRG
ncbi:MAG TPA: ImmA/IrrE family metallo-endopeptidase [Candidatus Dormibacteraeota bacterium]|nr:ImmA/IrrE family metallo-endopeptidase [Candidatus Dormibacteraeota bacterium]